MPNSDPRQILRSLEALSQIAPTPDATERAIASTQRRLLAAIQPQSRRTRRSIMKIVLPAGIAAAIVTAACLLLVAMPQKQATAAEMLRAAAASSRDFAGWIHARFDFIPQSWNREGITVKESTLHLHPVRQIRVKDTTFEGIRTVEWVDMAANIQETYDSASNTITIGSLPDDEKHYGSLTEKVMEMLRTEKKATAWQIGQTLFGMPTLDGITALVDNGWCGVAAVRDGENDRYTLTFSKDKLQDPAEATKASLVVLVDHKTGLMRKWIGTLPEGNLSLTFTYDDPDFRDIKDVGIPADAKTSQPAGGGHTTSDDASAILDRLDKLARSDEEIGPYTAVVTETADFGKKRHPERGMRIYGRHGQSQFYGLYRNMRQAPFLADLPGWPLPDVRATVTAAGDTLPDIVLACDGEAAWLGRVDRGSPVAWYPLKVEDLKGRASNYTLTAELWPGRHLIDFKHGSRINIGIQMLTSPDRPGQIGLQVDESGPAVQVMQISRVEYTWWIDPSRNDVLVEKARRFYDLNGQPRNEDVRKTTEYGQLPNGLCYPTAWTTQDIYFEGIWRNVSCTSESRLQLAAGMALEPVWFSKPQDRFRVVSEPQPATASRPSQHE